MSSEQLKGMMDMLTRLRKEHKITIMTSTQIPRVKPHLHHTLPNSTGPDVIFIDHMNLIRK